MAVTLVALAVVLVTTATMLVAAAPALHVNYTIRWHEGWCSNFLNLFANHDGIITSNFSGTEFPVIERAFVLVAVSMYRAEQSTTSALEAS